MILVSNHPLVRMLLSVKLISMVTIYNQPIYVLKIFLGLNQIIWQNLLDLINYLTTNDSTETDTDGRDRFNEGGITNDHAKSDNLLVSLTIDVI